MSVKFVLSFIRSASIAPNDRGYGHLAVCTCLPKAGERSLSPCDKVNAGAKLPKCTSASQ